VKLTYEQYVLFPNDGNRHEIIDGRHYRNAAPSTRHQAVSRYLQYFLFEQIELKGLGDVVDAPVDVQLSPTDVVQPDLVIVLKQNRIITPSKIMGAPDLVIEILSPSTRETDLNLKKQLYEQHQLNSDGRYDVPKICNTSIEYRGVPGGVSVDLTQVW